MPPPSPRRALVLGGIRSGKSEYAEALVAAATTVRYLATAPLTAGPDEPVDPAWAARVAAHQARRSHHWRTEELGADPDALADLVAAADRDDTLLVDDLGGWLTALMLAGPALTPIGSPDRSDPAGRMAGRAHPAGRMTDSTDPTGLADMDALTDRVARLTAAVDACPGRLVLVSPEVGLSLVPTTAAGRMFADLLGLTNRSISLACEVVVLVVAGNAVPVKGGL
jgi:nicotinate-nucleotide--dimethylbenzimidazole phosphoribosyltransferase